jgi:hypothetical protein
LSWHKGKQGKHEQSELNCSVLGADNDSQKSMLCWTEKSPLVKSLFLRCIENESNFNLIYCLRLLRVMELQHANEAHERGEIRPENRLERMP